MYYFEDNKDFIKKARGSCSRLMKELEVELRANGMNTQFFLVGSGARNMITRNENGAIDFDYNLNIITCENWKNTQKIKELVRVCFNKVLRKNKLEDVCDSKSALTTRKMFIESYPDKLFSIDVCIVTKDTSDEWQRLIHKKTGYLIYDEYIWNQAPNSNNYVEKANKIKSIPGWWEAVRNEYLNLKNMHLSHQDGVSSFESYIEAINNVYNHMKQKRIL